MPKLYFRFGVMSSSKTANLLMVSHNYKIQNKKILLIKPKLDTRYEFNKIISRAGLESIADLIIDNEFDLLNNSIIYSQYNCVLVDEVQFLSINQVNQLRVITLYTPVICYGLRTNYKSQLFPASKRLMEISDTIEEIKTTCFFCDKKAIINLKYSGKKIIKEGNDEIDIGAEEKYLGSCWGCWYSKEEL